MNTPTLLTNAEFHERLLKGQPLTCPCCNRFAQLYRRRLHAGIAAQLIRAMMLGADKHFIHTSGLVESGMTGVGDFSKAKYWGLVVAMPHVPGQKKTSGNWMLTPAGVAFVRGELRVPAWVDVFDDVVYEKATETIGVREALGQHFDYLELMASTKDA